MLTVRVGIRGTKSNKKIEIELPATEKAIDITVDYVGSKDKIEIYPIKSWLPKNIYDLLTIYELNKIVYDITNKWRNNENTAIAIYKIYGYKGLRDYNPCKCKYYKGVKNFEELGKAIVNNLYDISTIGMLANYIEYRKIGKYIYLNNVTYFLDDNNGGCLIITK